MGRFKSGKSPGGADQSESLVLELLEPRLLLTVMVEGVDVDGDLYQIKLTGPGDINYSSLENLTVSNTTLSSKLSITVYDVEGDGLVSVSKLDTRGDRLGRVQIAGDLGALDTAGMNRLEAQTMGAVPGSTGEYNFSEGVDILRVPGGISNAAVTVGGNLGLLRVGQQDDGSSNISNSTFEIGGNLRNMQLKQSLTGGSQINVNGQINTIDIDKSIMNSSITSGGSVGKISVDSGIRNSSTITVGGDLEFIKVKKTASDMTLDITGRLVRGWFGTDIRDSTILSGSIDKLLAKDDLNDTRIGVTGDLIQLKADDSRGMALRVSGTLHNLKIKRDMDEALVAALDGIEMIRLGQDLNRSTILGGIDIGPDFTMDTTPDGDDIEWGNVIIRNILVGGDMIDSSIAAGVNAMGSYYGDGNDEPTASDIGTARINRVIVKGEISSTFLPGESYAISAADGVDLVRCGRELFTGTAGVLLQQF